jgi:GDP-L-fucose synthase
MAIRDLAGLVARVIGYDGEIEWDSTKPDGTPRKLLDVSRIHSLGWKAAIDLEQGIRMTYDAFRAERSQAA